MARKLLILGAGQFGRMLREIAAQMHCFDRIDFLDDAASDALGALSDCKMLCGNFTDAVVAIGKPDVRLFWIEQLAEIGYNIPAIISHKAYIAPSAVIGDGSVIEPNATVQTGSFIDKGCIVASGAVVRHNATMQAGGCLDCNAVLLSGAVLPAQAKVPALTVYAN